MSGNLEGMRFVLLHNVERYPHFIAPAGARGTVVYDGGDKINEHIELQLDEHLPGAEDWDNCVVFYGNDFYGPDSTPGTCFDDLMHDARPLLTGEAARKETTK